jgi:hypothetical protein
MKVSKVKVSDDKKDAWLTLWNDEETEFCVIHIHGAELDEWRLSRTSLDISMKEEIKLE